MPRWLPKLLRRIHELAGSGCVRFTLKATQELAGLGIGLDAEDGCDVLAGLRSDDFAQRVESAGTGEWMYVFKPTVASTVIYLKVIVRESCLVVSFHEDAGHADEETS